MGNQQSVPPPGADLDGTPTLDQLGGYWRPAVSRKNELDMKMAWLGQAVSNQAEKMEDALAKLELDRETQLSALGGPKPEKTKVIRAFGTTMIVPVGKQAKPRTGLPSAGPRTQSITSRTGSVTNTNARGRGTPAPLSQSWEPGSPASTSMSVPPSPGARRASRSSYDLTGPSYGGSRNDIRPPSTRGGMRPMTADHVQLSGASSMMMQRGNPKPSASSFTSGVIMRSNGSLPVPNGQLGPGVMRQGTMSNGRANMTTSRPGTTQNGRSSIPPSRQGTMQSGARPGSSLPSAGMASRPGTRSSARNNKGWKHVQELEAKQQEQDLAIRQHWRYRVAAAKKRLYWYLQAYMAWCSVLKRKRRGYAETFTVEVLPIFLSNVLGESVMDFGEHLKEAGGLIEGGMMHRALTVATTGARAWLARARQNRMASEGGNGGVQVAARPSISRVLGAGPKTGGANKGNSVMRDRKASALPSSRQQEDSSGGIGMLTVKKAVIEASNKGGPMDARTRYQREIDVIKKLTNVYIQDHNQKKANETNQAVKSEQVSLQLLANRANGAWVPKYKWHSPTVLDSNALRSGGVDIDMYKQVIPQLLTQGKVAVGLIYTGEEMVVGSDAKGKDSKDSSIMVDLWSVLSKNFPHKVPLGQRITGLTALDRRVLQVIVDIEKQGGKPAVEQLKLVLMMDSQQVPWVIDQIVLHQHYSLRVDQIVVVSVARFPGMMWEDSTKTFLASYHSDYAYLTAGSGYGMLAMAWPSCGFHVLEDKSREYLAGSTLQWLAKEGVEWMHVGLLCDWEALTNNAPTMNPAFVGPAIYACDVKGANMAMEVVQSTGDGVARAQNSLVLSSDVGQLYSSSLTMQDLQSTASRPVMMTATKSGRVYSCCSRYLFSMKHLAKIVHGPLIFNPDVELQVPCAYLHLDIMDLTNPNNTRCVAVLGKARGPDPRPKAPAPKEWLRDFGPQLLLQDAQPQFRGLAHATTPANLTSVVTHSGDPATAGNLKGLRVLLFVKENVVSKAAFRMAKALMKQPGDSIVMVYVAHARSSYDEARKLLESYFDPLYEHQIKRKLATQVDKLADSMVSEIDTVHPDLVIMGSEALSESALAASKGTSSSMSLPLGSGLSSSTSMALAMAKALTDVPLLVVKTTNAGEMLSTSETPGVVPPMRVGLECQTNSVQLLQWLMQRLSPDRDKLVLLRPLGLDKDMKESNHTTRLLNALANEADSRRFHATRRPLAEGLSEGMTAAAVSDKLDMVAVLAPNAKVTPDHIITILKNARTSVLVWRGKLMEMGMGMGMGGGMMM